MFLESDRSRLALGDRTDQPLDGRLETRESAVPIMQRTPRRAAPWLLGAGVTLGVLLGWFVKRR